MSLALRYPAFTFETWNDLINQKDYGPTFGARLTLDLFYMYDRWFPLKAGPVLFPVSLSAGDLQRLDVVRHIQLAQIRHAVPAQKAISVP